MVRWSWGISSAGASYNLGDSRARAYCAYSRCGWGLFGHFILLYPFPPLSPSLCERARYRLKYCLKGPFNPKQKAHSFDAKVMHRRPYDVFSSHVPAGLRGFTDDFCPSDSVLLLLLDDNLITSQHLVLTSIFFIH